MQGIDLVESWSGYAVQVAGAGAAWLQFPVVSATGRTNLACHAGTVRFWFRPLWSSASLGGTGPGAPGQLVGLNAGDGGWSLLLDAGGDSVSFRVRVGGDAVECLSAPVAWQEGQWHFIALAYGPGGCALYLDGALAAAGDGTGGPPNDLQRPAQSFTLGGGVDGSNLAQGQFDELATFAYPQSQMEVQRAYAQAFPAVLLGPILPEEDEARRVLAVAAAAERQAGMSTLMGDEGEGEGGPEGGCAALTLTTTRLTNGNVKLTWCGRESGVVYDLFCATNISSAMYWAWVREIQPTNTELVVTNLGPSARFYRLARMVDTDGDGQRDFLYAEQQGQGFTLDTDDDNDGIPDDIEASWNSSPTDPASLPPAALHVSASGPASNADRSRDLPFRDLQTALKAATNYSVIQVLPGTYAGVSNRNLSFGGKAAVLISERGWEQTFLDGGDAGTNRAFVFTNAETWQTFVIGFTVSNAANSAVWCSTNAAPTFANCHFTLNRSTRDGGGAFVCTNASPTILNGRFTTNAAQTYGGALYAWGPNCRPRLSHCTLSDNTRQLHGGQVCSASNAVVTLNNCILWSVMANPGAEITNATGGSVLATYCAVRGGYAGTGNITNNPGFETNFTRRLTNNAACLDRGTTNSFAGFHLFTRLDMDGEARLDHAVTNTISPADIGADEFVYRLAFPTLVETNYLLDATGQVVQQANRVSLVDEASGVAFLGTNGNGRAVFAVIDDEQEDRFFMFTLNAGGDAIAAISTNSLLNTNYTGNQRQVLDLEGLAYDATNRRLYAITSHTKSRKYRGVENTLLDPLQLAPTNDYDRRRNVLASFEVGVNLDAPDINTSATRHFEPEDVAYPYNVCYTPGNGLIGFIRQTLNAALFTAQPLGAYLLIASNTVNKSGAPSNGTSYAAGNALPGGGGVLGVFGPGTNSFTHSGLATNRTYYDKTWIVGAGNVYREFLSSSAETRGYPTLFINEFIAESSGGTVDTIELYNPLPYDVSLLNYRIMRFAVNGTGPDATTWLTNAPPLLPGGSFTYFYANGAPFHAGQNLTFTLRREGGQIRLTTANTNEIIDHYVYGDDQKNNKSQGRAWDGGPSGKTAVPGFQNQVRRATQYQDPTSPVLPTTIGGYNHGPVPDVNFFLAASGTNKTDLHLSWRFRTNSPAVRDSSPKDHDNHSINIEGLAYRSPTAMIIGLRSPLSVDRLTGNAFYYLVTNTAAFLPTNGGWPGLPAGVTGPHQLNLGGQGIRGLAWCAGLGTNGAGRYLIIGGPANGGPPEKERVGDKFSLYSWDRTNAPVKLIADMGPYTVRPEGVCILVIGGQQRVLFYRGSLHGHGLRDAQHHPLAVGDPRYHSAGTVQPAHSTTVCVHYPRSSLARSLPGC